MEQRTKLSYVKEAMANGEWQTAILLAAKFPDLGAEKEAIQRGREAILRPIFLKQLKRDPTAIFEAAKAALQRRYGNA